MTDTYLDILRNCNVEQIVDFPTRGNKTLDIFLTSKPGLIDAVNLYLESATMTQY
jgi:hypothetical protein